MTRRSRRKMIAKLIQRIKQLVEVQCSLLRSGFCFRRRAAGNAGRNPTFRRGRRPSPTIRRGWGLYSGWWPLQAEVPRVVTGRTAEVVPDPFGAGAAHTPQEGGRPQADRFVAPRAFDAGGDRVWQRGQADSAGGGAAIPMITFPRISELEKRRCQRASRPACGSRRDGP